MNETTSGTSTGRSQRRKSLSVKAKEYAVIREYLDLEVNILNEDITDPYIDSSQSDSPFSTTSEDTSSSSETSNEHKESESDEEVCDNVDAVKPKFLLPNKVLSKRIADVTTRKPKATQSYTIKAEDYFYNHSLKKNQTSNHTLDKLKKPRLSQNELQKLLSNMTLTENHKDHIDDIHVQNKNHFEKWLCLLHEGFNVLVYGLGSKRNILHDFHKECLKNMPVIVVNGFFPSLTMKEIIDSIMTEILEVDHVPSNLFKACEIIADQFHQYPNLHLYLIIHNIEGETLRSNLKNQSVLANLAAIDKIHLVASIDHINAPLIWDQNKLSKFNFTWWDITTFQPYQSETSFETSMMITKTGSLALSSLRNVFLSLTSNSKGIYLIIAKYQLKNAGQFYQGMLFKDLYWACREAFLVSSDLALRAQLTEFIDHKMVKFRRSVDGAEHLLIPIPNSLLQQFVNDQ